MNTTVKKFLGYYKPYYKIFWADMFCAITASLIALAYPILVRLVTNQGITAGGVDMPLISKIIPFFFVLSIIEYFCNYYITYIGHVMGAKMEYDMRNDLFQHYQKLSFSYYDNAKTGQLMSRITNDLFDVTELAHHGPEDLIISVIKILGAFVILIRIHVPLTLIIFGIIPIMFVYAFIYNRKMKKAFKKNRQRIAEINSQIEDSLSGVRVVKSFANEDIEIKKFKKGNDHFIDSKRTSYQYMGKYHSGLSFFISMINLAAIGFGALFISQSRLSISDLVTYLLYIGILIEPIKKLINFTEQFQNGATGFERFLEVLNVQPDIEDTPDAISLDRVTGAIDFKDVTFRYEENAQDVLSHVNLHVNAGEYVALVGTSGVGKTTLCSLIPRFYDVNGGKILLDGTDIKNIKIKSLREQIGIVQQDVYLFAGSIKENIAYGKPNATEEEIIQAAIKANAHDFIIKLPQGYDTDIGQRGVKLSGGQKQRLSIARVFLKNPPILIFDEATSALDNESEKIVQESLEILSQNRTTFVIAHRLSTIKNAETILVLTPEGIKERGTHEELLAKKGIYERFYHLSLHGKEASSF